VVPVTPLDNPHRTITRGKTGFKVVSDHLVLTAATSSPTPSPIPSSARAALVDPHWRAATEDEYGALINNGTWELVPRPQGTVRTVLATVVSRTWPIQQLDVKNVFLHGTLSETVFCCQPTGFVDPAHPDLVCRLHKYLYGLK
jgi:hypothetical protein